MTTPGMNLSPENKSIITIAALLVLGLPLAFILTMLLFPFWSWLETLTGVESMGHSGPAGWCYLAVYSAMLLACFVGARVAIRRALHLPTRKPE